PDAIEPRPARELPEQALGSIEPEDLELSAEEGAGATVQDEPDVTEVRGDVGRLELAVQRVHERLHLLRDARRDAAVRRLEDQPRAAYHRPQVGDEAPWNRHRGDHLSGPQLARGLLAGEAYEVDGAAHPRDRPVDVEAVAADDDLRREVILVHERDTRLRARVAGHEADEPRDDERVRDEDGDEYRRAPQDAQVHAQQ